MVPGGELGRTVTVLVGRKLRFGRKPDKSWRVSADTRCTVVSGRHIRGFIGALALPLVKSETSLILEV